MVNHLQVLPITEENAFELASFIENLGEEQESFRYFKSRGLEVIGNHAATLLLLYKGNSVGYGHLDIENDVVWLGIVVKQNYQGKGFAKEIMKTLVNKAEELKLEKIQLSVDNNNKRAIELYKRFGFKLAEKKIDYSILKKELSNIYDLSIAISTLAFQNKSREDIVALANKNNWTIEFSSSFPYQEDMSDFFTKIKIKRLAHNYFPAPKEPFVINLASTNEAIRQKSIAHSIQGLRLSKKCGSNYFSAHAGFCIDPDPYQLGKQLDVNAEINRSLNWKLFLDSVKLILLEAKRLNISFLIENNVTAKFNLRNDGQEVLFCSKPDEMIKLIKEINSDKFGLLLDTAHLKVSSQALNFDKNVAVEKIKPFVKYIHHSDNDGLKDTNESITEDYWFLSWMKEFVKCIHVLEVKNKTLDEIKTQLNLLYKNGHRENTYI